MFEFKVLGSNRENIENLTEQLRKKGYAEKYRKDILPIYEIGIVFDPESRNIVRWEVQEPEKLGMGESYEKYCIIIINQ